MSPNPETKPGTFANVSIERAANGYIVKTWQGATIHAERHDALAQVNFLLSRPAPNTAPKS